MLQQESQKESQQNPQWSMQQEQPEYSEQLQQSSKWDTQQIQPEAEVKVEIQPEAEVKVEIHPETQAEPQAEIYPEIHPSTHLQTNPETGRYAKIGGWLLLFVLFGLVGIFYNLYTSITLLLQATDVWAYFPEDIFSALVIEAVGSIALLVAVIFQAAFVSGVLSRKPLFLRFNQLSHISLFVSAACFIAANNIVGFEYLDTRDALILGANPLIAVIGFVLFTYYYSRSERVKAFMGTMAYNEKALTIFRKRTYNTSESKIKGGNSE
jgi:hypothetical protein